MSNTKSVFVLVHGGWHNSACWRLVTPLLKDRGHIVRAFDLPAAGVQAKVPMAYNKRPLDVAAFAAEVSPVADVTQADRTRVTISQVEEAVTQAGMPVVLVGHSMGGLTISQVAEAVPNLLSAVVYVAAFLIPPGLSAFTLPEHLFAESVLPQFWIGDSEAIGALRLDPRSDDADYQYGLKISFYGDSSDSAVVRALGDLHCDEPVAMMLEPSAITPGRFGQVPRHYVRCLEDRAIPLSMQDFMITAVDEAMGNSTIIHTLACDHSPFYSQPQDLADILVGAPVRTIPSRRVDP